MSATSDGGTPLEAGQWAGALSLLDGHLDRHPRRHRLTWAEWCGLLTTWALAEDKATAPAWSPALYPDGATRAAAHVEAIGAIVLDYDDGTPMSVGRAPWRGWPHIAHTSWSHRPGAPKWRLIVPLERPVEARWWPRVWTWATDRAAGVPDRRCSDASRLYYLPAVSGPTHPREAWVWDEPSCLLELDLDALPPTPEERAAASARERVGALRDLARRPDDRREAAERLKSDGDARRALAVALGAVVVDGGAARPRADRVRCPACGRASVAWMLDPGSSVRAWCSHRNSCGGTWFLDELAKLAGVEVGA